MGEINLLNRYPKSTRNLTKRAEVSAADRELACRFGEAYFDGTRDQGYGGYRYDGRWVPIVDTLCTHYGLKDNSAILDVGSAKGFLLHDFRTRLPNATLIGLDISRYAIEHGMPDTTAFTVQGSAHMLPFKNDIFDLVISINTIHNLHKEACASALGEISRVSRRHAFITVDAFRNEEEKVRMNQWNLTAKTYMSTAEWEHFFAKAGYQGDYYWFIP